MKAWQQRCRNTLLNDNLDTQQVMDGAVTLAKAMDFDYCCYALEAPLPVHAPRTFVLSNFEPDLLARLYDLRGKDTMPPARHARISGLPIFWPPAEYPPEDADFWAGVIDLDAVGVTLPASYRGGSVGCLTLVRMGCNWISEQERTANLRRWEVLTQDVDQAMRQRVEAALMPEIKMTLNDIERQVLVWAADGKTAWDTGKLTGQSERTVRWYRDRAMDKLGAKNLTEAVARAVALGLLTRPAELVMAAAS